MTTEELNKLQIEELQVKLFYSDLEELKRLELSQKDINSIINARSFLDIDLDIINNAFGNIDFTTDDFSSSYRELEEVKELIINFLSSKNWTINELSPTNKNWCGDMSYRMTFDEKDSRFKSEDYDLSYLVVDIEYCSNYFDDTGNKNIDDGIMVRSFICQDLSSFQEAQDITIALKDLKNKQNEIIENINNWIDDDLRQEYIDTFTDDEEQERYEIIKNKALNLLADMMNGLRQKDPRLNLPDTDFETFSTSEKYATDFDNVRYELEEILRGE